MRVLKNVKLGEGSGSSFCVVTDAFELSSGRFSPAFVIYEGSSDQGRAIKRQAFPAIGANYATADEALKRASELAGEWLTTNRV